MEEHDRIALPRLDPDRTPFTETRAFRRYGVTDDPDPGSPEALYTKAVIQEQGFDGPPHVVSQRRLDSYVAAGEVELFRGVTDARFAEQLRSGGFFVGRGGEISGMYAAAGPHALAVARHYAALGDGTLVRMTLKRDARVVTWRDLEMTEAAEIQRTAHVPQGIAPILYNDLGVFAAYVGYDAIHIVEFPDVDHYVVLNRTALRIQRENMR
jgi:hypothetical protein